MSHTTSEKTEVEQTRDRWFGLKRDGYLLRIDFYLESLVWGRERRQIHKSLRVNINTEGKTRSWSDILRDLGHPQDLARGYADGSAVRPHWIAGIICGAVALTIYWLALASYTLGMLAVAHGSTLTTAHSRFFFVDVEASSDSTGVGIGFTQAWAALIVPLVIVGVTVLLAGRAWRVFTRRTAA